MKPALDIATYLAGACVLAFFVMAIWMYRAARDYEKGERDEAENLFDMAEKKRQEALEAKQHAEAGQQFEVPVFMRDDINLNNVRPANPVEAQLVKMMLGNATVGELDDVYNGLQPKRGRGRPKKQLVH